MAKILTAACVLLFSVFWWNAASAAGPIKLAYVDVPRAMAASNASQRFLKTFKKKLSSKRREVRAMEAEIKRMKTSLDKRKNLMSRGSASDLAEKIRRKYRQYQRLVEDNQAIIDRDNSNWTKKITDAMKKVIEQIAREKGYTAVFAKGQVLFYDAEIDITDLVLKRLNTYTRRW